MARRGEVLVLGAFFFTPLELFLGFFLKCFQVLFLVFFSRVSSFAKKDTLSVDKQESLREPKIGLLKLFFSKLRDRALDELKS